MTLRRLAALLGILGLSLIVACETGPAPPLEVEVIEASSTILGEDIRLRSQKSRPGEMHERLAVLAGNWTVEITTPGTDPSRGETGTAGAKRERLVARGESRIEWILGGRFLRWTTNTTLAGEPHEAEGLLGYDSQQGEYQFLWLSDTNAGLRIARGNGRPWEAGVDFRLDGATRAQRSRLKVHDHEHFVMEQYGPVPAEEGGADGDERLLLRTRYRRIP